MKIIIAGAGEVGSHLAKLLSREDQDIYLIDKEQEKLAPIDASYNLLTITGNPISFETLERAGVKDCDLFIAVTPFETENIISCELASSLGARKTVARIDNYEFMEPEHAGFFRSVGVGTTIYPEYLAALEIKTAMKRTWVRNWFELHDGQIIVVGVKLRENARFAGMQLKEFAAREHHFHVSAIRRRHDIIIPRGDDRLQAGDVIYFTTTRPHIDNLRQLCGKHQVDVRRVLIMGGNRIAIRLCSLLERDSRFSIKIIESNRERCVKLAEKCPNAEVVYGDARNIEVLRAEGIETFDCFIALSDSSEANILTCLTAKELGVRKTIAEVENIQFISEAEGLNIGTVINKKLLASSRIFQILLDSDSTTSRCLALADAEVAEIEVKPGSKVTRAQVKDLSLSRDMTIGGLVRNGQGMLVSGNTLIQAGDRVVVFCLQGALHKVEKLFS